MAEQFYTILTNVGKAKIANAIALGTTVQISQIAVGDGGGTYYNPSETQTALVNEVWRGNISRVEPDPNNPNWIIVEAVIPPDQGGFYIREVGIFDSVGDLIAIGKYPETYKPTFTNNNAGKDLVIRCILEVSNASAVELKVDPTTVIATVQSVEDRITHHDQDPNAHSGILTQLSNHTQNTAIHTPVVTVPQVSGLNKIKYGNTLTLTASGSKTAFRDEGAVISEYEWILPDGSIQVIPADATESATLSYQIQNDPNLVGTTYTFKVRGKDSFGNVSDWATHNVLISDNTPPIIDSVNWYEADGTTPVSTFYEGQTYRVEIVASDLENDPLSYSLTFTDPSVSVTDLGGGWFEVTFPLLTSDTTYNYTVSVSDGVDTKTQSYSLDVFTIRIFEVIYKFNRRYIYPLKSGGIYKDGYIYVPIEHRDTSSSGELNFFVMKLTWKGDLVWCKRIPVGTIPFSGFMFWCGNSLILVYADSSNVYVVFINPDTGDVTYSFTFSYSSFPSLITSVFSEFFYLSSSPDGIYKFSMNANGQWFVEESFTDGIQNNVIFLDPDGTGSPTTTLHIKTVQDQNTGTTTHYLTVASYDGNNFNPLYETSIAEPNLVKLNRACVYSSRSRMAILPSSGSFYILNVGSTEISYISTGINPGEATANVSEFILGSKLITIDQDGTVLETSGIGYSYLVNSPPSKYYGLHYLDLDSDNNWEIEVRMVSEPLAFSYSACLSFSTNKQTLNWTALTSSTPSQNPVKNAITNPFSSATVTPTDETLSQICFSIV